MEFSFPPGTPWGFDDMEMRLLDGKPPEGFDCGRDEQNRFLYERARRDAKKGVTVTHLLFIKGVLAAYVTLTMDRLVLGPTEKPKGVSYRVLGAMKIAQLAVDRRFTGHGLGQYIVSFVVEYAISMRALVGCRYITLDAEQSVIGWYERIGFVRNLEEQAARRQLAADMGRDVDEIPVSMRFDLREPADA